MVDQVALVALVGDSGTLETLVVDYSTLVALKVDYIFLMVTVGLQYTGGSGGIAVYWWQYWWITLYWWQRWDYSLVAKMVDYI